MASRPGPEAAKQPQTITLPPPCFTIGMMFLLWNAVLALRQMERDPCLSKSSTFDSSVHRILSQKSWGVIKMFFFGKCEMSLCVLFGHQWFLPCNSPMDAISAQSLSNLESWTLTLTEASQVCSSLDASLGSFVTSWMSCQCASWMDILAGRPFLGRFTTVPNCLHL